MLAGALLASAPAALAMPSVPAPEDPVLAETEDAPVPGPRHALHEPMERPTAQASTRSGAPLPATLADWFGRCSGPHRPGDGREAAGLTVCSAVRLGTEGNASLTRLVRSLQPVRQPLSRLLPRNALAAWDLGARPDIVAEAVAHALQATAPRQHRWLLDRLAELRAAGVDPASELLPALGQGIGGGLLPPVPGEPSWPLPRPVWIFRVDDAQAVARALPRILHWWAGAVADLSGGLASAVWLSEEVGGVSVLGLQIEGVLEGPLPSPAAALANGVLIVSPVRSAVLDVLAEPRRQGGDDQAGDVAEPRQAVGLLRGEPRALAVLLEPPVPRLSRFASVLGLPSGGPGPDTAEQLARTFLQVARGVEEVAGAVDVGADDDSTWLLIERDVRLAGSR